MSRKVINLGQAFARSEEYAAILAWFEAGNRGAARDVPTILTAVTAQRYISFAYKAGRLYVCGWERRAVTGPPLPILAYQTGGLADAPRPAPLPESVKVAKWAKSARGRECIRKAKERRRKDPERRLEESHYHKARYYRNNPKTVEQIDPLLAALTRKK